MQSAPPRSRVRNPTSTMRLEAAGMYADNRGMVSRAVRIIRLVAEHGSATLPELVAASGLPKSTVHRVAHELVREGVLVLRANHYSVTPLVFELGTSSPNLARLRNAAVPVMEDIYECTHHVVHLAVLSEDDRTAEALIVEKIMGRRSAVTASRVGARIPLHSTASGKVLLAFGPPGLLDTVARGALSASGPNTIRDGAELRREVAGVREAGVAYDRQEAAEGVWCVAAPIFMPEDRDGASAVMSITLASNEDLPALATVVKVAARAVARELGSMRSQATAGGVGRRR